MNLKKLTSSHFKDLLEKGISLDHIYLLLHEDVEFNTPKLEALKQGLLRRSFITETGKITVLGKELLDSLQLGKTVVTKVKKVVGDFDKWWKTYPGTDTFVYKGKTFSGARSLRTKKDECEAKLAKILNEGEYTIDELIEALEYEVMQKKENSIKTKTNKLSFMQNSLTYLNQRSFEPFIELIKEGIKLKEEQTPSGGVDI